MNKSMENQKDLISVIVPVYKVEKYLDRCVESIANQTYENLEIILVDDGSPDNCPVMCDKWAEKDCRIKVIHKNNGGLSDARNAGMEIATGGYVAFVDSDDWIEKKYVEFLYNAIVQTNADMSACQMRSVQENEEAFTVEGQQLQIETFSTEEALDSLINGRVFRAVAWNKLYKRENLLGEKFELGKLHEDEFFTYRIIDKCSLLAWVDTPLYNYYQRSGSIMSTYSVRHLDTLEAMFGRLELLKSKYPKLYLHDKVTYCVSCLNYYCDMINGSFGEEKQLAKKQILNYRNKIKFSIREWFALSLKNKIYAVGSSAIFIKVFATARSLKGYN